jgi:adenine-specific DNA methylase
MQKIPEKSIKLICTDPPHSDRIPYLELSEMWNAILNKNVIFEKEIVVSNAKERNKKKTEFIEKMKLFMRESSRILTDDGMLLIYFNARDQKSWQFLEITDQNINLEFIGTFPMEYSTNSVVQDNKKGGMKTDYVLVFKKKGYNIELLHKLNHISGWSNSLPKIVSPT